MIYALNARITLPFSMASFCIAEINIGRYATHQLARDGHYEFMRREDITTFDKILTILEEDMGMDLCVHPVIVEEL